MTLRQAILVALASAAAATAAAGAATGTLEGRWRLVEQRYERGGYNFAPDAAPVVLELAPGRERLSGQLRWDGHRAAWPAYPTPDGPATLRSVRVSSTLDARGATATYRVEPAAGDDTWLVVREEYRLADDGRLICTVDVRFERGGTLRGGFTWHRVFEREAGL